MSSASQVESATLSFPIAGMDCDSCAKVIERVLRKTPGVSEAAISYATERGRVVYDPAQLQPEVIRDRIKAVGYTALIGATAHEDQQEQRAQNVHRLQLKVIVSLVAAGLIMLPDFLAWFSITLWPDLATEWLRFSLATIVLAWAGRTFFASACKAAMFRETTMDTLVAVGTGTAYLYSFVAMVWPSLFTNAGQAPRTYFDVSVVIIALVLLGKYLESRAKVRTNDSLVALAKLAAQDVSVIRHGQEVRIPATQVIVGDQLIVRPGELIAIDGIVVDGQSTVDESLLTGESMPVEKSIDGKVWGGTMNNNGAITIRATNVGASTALGRIIAIVESAQSSRAPIQRLADRVARIFVPIVIGIAILTFIVWMVAAPAGVSMVGFSLLFAVTVLIIACPCAMGLATPTAVVVGIGQAAKRGILIRDATGLELLAKIDTIVFDKTGTITTGHLTVDASTGADSALQLAAALESKSEHPIARAITDFAQKKGLTPLKVQQFTAARGFGISGMVDQRRVVVGSPEYLAAQNISFGMEQSFIDQQRANGATVIVVAIDGREAACYSIVDEAKPTSATVIQQLQQRGIAVWMLSGDHQATAAAVAAQVGIPSGHVRAGIQPDAKATVIAQLIADGRTVAMVGDGVNDAPALSAATVGIAMGSGADIAKDAAVITIVGNDLRQVATSLDVAQQTVRTIRQNLFWAFFYNIIGIPIAAGALYPAWHITLNPMIASGAMACSSLFVVLNSLRLKSQPFITK